MSERSEWSGGGTHGRTRDSGSMIACPHCGGALAVSVTAPTAGTRPIKPEEWLAPCQLAGRLGIGEPYVRKLIRRGMLEGLPGFTKEGGRLSATIRAVKALWA
jgi:hypothetical protein